jgi:hypothetical protein
MELRLAPLFKPCSLIANLADSFAKFWRLAVSSGRGRADLQMLDCWLTGTVRLPYAALMDPLRGDPSIAALLRKLG